MKDIVIIGSGGFGREVAWLIEQINEKAPTWNLLGYIDDQDSVKKVGKHNVIGNVDWLKKQSLNVVCAIGDPVIKKKVLDRLKSSNNTYPTLVHPNVTISSSTKVGSGSIICEGTILTVDITVGNHVIINLDCTVGHDAILEDYVTILPSVNISGNTLIKHGSMIGTGSAIIQGITIGEKCIIGAGSVVVRDIPDDVTAFGNPCRVKKV